MNEQERKNKIQYKHTVVNDDDNDNNNNNNNNR